MTADEQPAVARAVDVRKQVALVAATVALTAYPPLYAYLRSGIQGAFSYIHGDSFLYLGVAERSGGGVFSYDGSTPTNGFHPLWEYILTAFLGHPAQLATARPIVVTLLLSTLLAAAGLSLMGLAIFRYTRSLFLSLLVVPGLYFVFIGTIYDNMSVWQFLGGMESSLCAFLGGAMAFVLARQVCRPHVSWESLFSAGGLKSLFWQLGLILPWVTLARLDDVFMVPAFVLVIYFAPVPLRQRVLAAVRVAAPSAIVVLAYMIYNYAYAGSPMPVSGMTKGGFAFPKSIYVLAAGLFPPIADLKNLLVAKQSDIGALQANVFRCVLMLFPAVFALCYILYVRATRRMELKFVLPIALALGMIGKAGYNLVNVNLWHQGPWYYALNVVLTSFLGAILLGPARAALARLPVWRIAVPGFYALFTLSEATSAAVTKLGEVELHTPEWELWADRDAIAARLRAAVPAPKLVAFDDGITGYALPFATIHGFGFAADIATYRALQSERLLEHCYRRGHDVITSTSYLQMPTPVHGSDALREYLKQSFLEDKVKAELDRFDFELLFVFEKTKVPFIKFWPRAPQHG